MAKKKKNKKVDYEEIDGYKYEVKNPLRKNLVKVYQDMVANSQAEYVARNRMMENKRKYAENLLKNISRAPFVLGWLCWPEDEVQIRVINILAPIEEKKSKKRKPTAPKKPKSPKKPTAPKKPTMKKKG